MTPLKITIYFNGGTSLMIERPGLIKVDPHIRVMMIKDENGDDLVFVLDHVKYWNVMNAKVTH